MMAESILGRQFGSLTVLAQLASEKERSTWYCSCACGGFKITSRSALVKGHTASCGCLRFTHRQTGSLVYKVWGSMRARCNNPKDKSYAHYGGRGIKVCARWNNFEAFLEDMGPRPPGSSIDRKNNDRGYEPENCYWATSIEQMSNTRRNRHLTAGGETKTMAEWVRSLGGGSALIIHRLNLGWTEEQACLTPIGQPRNQTS